MLKIQDQYYCLLRAGIKGLRQSERQKKQKNKKRFQRNKRSIVFSHEFKIKINFPSNRGRCSGHFQNLTLTKGRCLRHWTTNDCSLRGKGILYNTQGSIKWLISVKVSKTGQKTNSKSAILSLKLLRGK